MFFILLSILFFSFHTPVHAKCWYQKKTCEVDGITGICADSSNSNCCGGGKWTSGKCPGPANIQCCTSPTCITKDEDAGVCLGISQCKDTPSSGLCSGPDDLQCCLTGKKAIIEKDDDESSSSKDSVEKKTDFYGVDVSTSISKATWECMKSSTPSIDWAIVRGYRSNGKVDPRACASLKNALDAKISVRDAYIFPCPLCPSLSGEAQVKAAIDNLQACAGNPWTGVLWLDIEGTQYWSDNKTTNEEFFQSMLDGCTKAKVQCDVYTSKSQWDPIMGNSQKGKDMRLWYAQYQTPPQTNFKKWKAFGGWTEPFAKQYQGDVGLCGATVDKNWSPNDPAPTTATPPSDKPDDDNQQDLPQQDLPQQDVPLKSGDDKSKDAISNTKDSGSGDEFISMKQVYVPKQDVPLKSGDDKSKAVISNTVPQHGVPQQDVPLKSGDDKSKTVISNTKDSGGGGGEFISMKQRIKRAEYDSVLEPLELLS